MKYRKIKTLLIGLMAAAGTFTAVMSVPYPVSAAEEKTETAADKVQSTKAHKSAEEVEAEISALPDEDNTDTAAASYISAVTQAMEDYNSLTSAEKIQITDAEKLKSAYEDLQESGAITDNRDNSDNDDTQTEDSDEKTDATDFVFKLEGSDDKNDAQATVVIHFTTDSDDDGEMDRPDRIVLTSPSGNSTPINTSSSQISDDTVTAALTWTKNYVQIDISKAETGNWEITTSSPCAFNRTAYAGVVKEIPSEETKIKKQKAEDTPEPEKEPEKSQRSNGRGGVVAGILAVFVVIGGIIAAMLILPKKINERKAAEANGAEIPEEDDPDELNAQSFDDEQFQKAAEAMQDKEQDADEEDRRAEAEEERKRQEAAARVDARNRGSGGWNEENTDNDADNASDENEGNSENQPEGSENDGEDTDDDVDSYEEGDTDILNQNMRPKNETRPKSETSDDPFNNDNFTGM